MFLMARPPFHLLALKSALIVCSELEIGVKPEARIAVGFVFSRFASSTSPGMTSGPRAGPSASIWTSSLQADRPTSDWKPLQLPPAEVELALFHWIPRK